MNAIRVAFCLQVMLAQACVFTSRPIIPDGPDSALPTVDAALDRGTPTPDAGTPQDRTCHARSLPDGGVDYAMADGTPCQPFAGAGESASSGAIRCDWLHGGCLPPMTPPDGGVAEDASTGEKPLAEPEADPSGGSAP